jgi:hypothetical protein
MRKIFLMGSILAWLSVAGCGDADSPETQVRHALDAIEQASERRDVGEVMEWVSPEFRSPHGQDTAELRKYLYGFFIANQSVHLLTRIDSLEFPAPDEARVDLTVGMASREAASASAWNLATEVHDFHVALRREGEDWKVIFAERRSR